MTLFNRIGTKARKVGTSLVTTIPLEIVKDWNLKPNDQLVMYLLDGMTVIVPLAYLGTRGEPPLIRKLIDLTWEARR